MRLRTVAAATACAATTFAVTAAAAPPAITSAALALARQTLPAGDGWGSAGTGTTGGSAAAAADVRLATDRASLIAALGGDNVANRTNATPKIVFIAGKIDV